MITSLAVEWFPCVKYISKVGIRKIKHYVLQSFYSFFYFLSLRRYYTRGVACFKEILVSKVFLYARG